MDDPHNALVNAYKSYVDNVSFIQNVSLDAMRSYSVEEFLTYLEDDASERFELDHVHLVVGGYDGAVDDLHPALRISDNASIAKYRANKNIATRAIKTSIIDNLASLNRKGSEAVLNLTSDGDEFEAILVLSSADPKRFAADQTTDLMEYYRNVLAIKMEQWLDR